MIPTAFNDNAIFQEAFKIAELANLTHEEWQKYQYSLKTYRDNLATDSYLHEQGKKEGIIQIAKLMKSSGEPTDKIAQYTNLSPDEIDRL
ncbi:Uncharacterised protein [Moraxella lacunata]|uniref:Transposase n=2 Tax=Moraxella lacunata TaxID=477 RepID=A0A1V4H1J5_MORLA|nr:hypothetical protein [Moraxella lacunata]OPH38799.1 hypothetical protein B5J94_02235 [Moraxella lacunata]STZ01436.1 Uncharacterised protein [Moraxella lacunata]